MMAVPDQAIFAFAHANQSEPHQWRLGEIEWTGALISLKLGESFFLCCRRERTPIVPREWQRGSAQHDLQRHIQILPDKGRAQHCVALDRKLPSALQGI